jgi:hypothetical protein
MKPAQLKRIIQHGENLLAIFPNARIKDPLDLCRKLRRLETRARRSSIDYCNGVLSVEQWETATDQILTLVKKVVGETTVPIFVNGDARGYALKIEDVWMLENACNTPLYSDWGGYGIIAPEID